MARNFLGMLVVGVLGMGLAVASAHAGEEALKKKLADLNNITGDDTRQDALKSLLDDKKLAQELLKFALPAAQKKDLSYNTALILALAAADQKDMKTAEVYFGVCMDQAAKLQSFAKLQQAYGLPIELYYADKQYANAARVCKKLLELNTDDGKEREVLRTVSNRFGEAEIPQPGSGEPNFDTAERLRPYVLEIFIKSTAKQGKYDQAIQLVDGLIKKSDDWIDRQLKGWVLKEAGKLEDAASIYENVIKEIGKDQRLNKKLRDQYIRENRYEVSNVYIEMKKIDRASEHLEYLVKMHPENPVFYNDLGYIWADNDMKLEEAEKLIRKAIDLHREIRKKAPDFDPKTDQDSGAFLDSLGWALFRQKKNQEAKEWLLKAIEDKSSAHIEIYDHLADVHMALGERDLAIKAWQEGLKHVNDSRRDKERKAEVEKKLEKAKNSK